MRQANNGTEQEGMFQDEACNQCVEKITHLKGLIEIEEKKLFKAMRNAKKTSLSLIRTSF
ncbi:MAG TPA: hypothetical protein VGU44_04700 [Gammaproteobacteria bacterium]|nr:hypothetical protein [Gammaproteobacteria bacterium]